MNSIKKVLNFEFYSRSICNILNLTDDILFDGICWAQRSQRGLNCKSSLLGPGDPNILPYNTLARLNIGKMVKEKVNCYF